MTEYNEIKGQGSNDIIDIEEFIRGQIHFKDMTVEGKVNLFKDYLFLQARRNPNYDASKEEDIYDDIRLGKNGLNDVLYAIAENMKDGSDCLEELNSDFIKGNTYGNNELSNEQLVAKSEEYVKNAREGSINYFHNQLRNEKLKNMAADLKAADKEFEKLEEEFARSEYETNKNLANQPTSNDLTSETEKYADAAKFAQELDQLEDEAYEQAKEEAELEELFPENRFVQEARREKFNNRKDFLDATDRNDVNHTMSDTADIDIIEEKIDEMTAGSERKIKDMPTTQEEMEREKKLMEEAQAFDADLSESFKTASDAAAKQKEQEDLEELFPENEGVKKAIAERGGRLKPLVAPDNDLQTNLDELYGMEAEELGNLDTGLKNEEFEARMKEEAADTIKFAEDLASSEKSTIEYVAPEVEERDAAYRELDRIEQILKDQTKFDALSDREKIKLMQSYIINDAVTQPEYSNHMRDEIERQAIMTEITKPLEAIAKNIKSGENVKNELDGMYLKKALLKDVHGFHMKFINEYFEMSERDYLSHVSFIGGTEKSNNLKADKKEEKFKSEIEELGELFPDNEQVLEQKAKEAREAEKRINQKKAERAEKLRKEQEIKKKRNEMIASNTEGLKKRDEATAKAAGLNTKTEEERLKTMTPEEAEKEVERLKGIFYGNGFKKMNVVEKKKLVKDLLFANGMVDDIIYDLNFIKPNPEFARKQTDAMYWAIYQNIQFDTEILGVVGKIKDGRDLFKIAGKSKTLRKKISDNIKPEYKNNGSQYTAEDMKELDQQIAEFKAKYEKEEQIRKNPKKAPKSFDNYILAHTGSKAGQTKEEMLKNMAKVTAAMKLQKEGKKFSLDKIHEMADRLEGRYPKCLTDKPKFEEQLRNGLSDRENAEEFASSMNTALFGMDVRNFSDYQKNIKKILDNMSSPKGRTEKYNNFYNSVKAVAELDISKAAESDEAKKEIEAAIISANDKLFDSAHAYIKGYEKVRKSPQGVNSFNNALDVFSTVTKYSNGVSVCTQKVIDDINAVRGKNQPLDRDMRNFLKNYGSERAASVNQKKEKAPQKEAGKAMGKQ